MLPPGRSRPRDSAGHTARSAAPCRAPAELDNDLQWHATLLRCAAKAGRRRHSKEAGPPAVTLRAPHTAAEFVLVVRTFEPEGQVREGVEDKHRCQPVGALSRLV